MFNIFFSIFSSQGLKLFLGNHKIEHLPDDENSEMIVSLDGEKLAISDSETYLYREGDEHAPIFYIDYSEPYFTLRSEKYGLIVERIGDTITVFVSFY